MKTKTWSVLSVPIAAKIRATVACLAKPNHVGRLGVALALCSALETNSLAQNLGFPEPAPHTPILADKQFTDRAKVVIETNACGREDDYLRILAGDGAKETSRARAKISSTSSSRRLPTSVPILTQRFFSRHARRRSRACRRISRRATTTWRLSRSECLRRKNLARARIPALLQKTLIQIRRSR